MKEKKRTNEKEDLEKRKRNWRRAAEQTKDNEEEKGIAA